MEMQLYFPFMASIPNSFIMPLPMRYRDDKVVDFSMCSDLQGHPTPRSIMQFCQRLAETAKKKLKNKQN